MTNFCFSVSSINFSCDMQLSNLSVRRIISNVAVFDWYVSEMTGSHFLRNRRGDAVVVVRPDGSAFVDLKKLGFSDFRRVECFLIRAGIFFKAC